MARRQTTKIVPAKSIAVSAVAMTGRKSKPHPGK